MKRKFLVAAMVTALAAALPFIPEAVAFVLVIGILIEFIIRGSSLKEEEL